MVDPGTAMLIASAVAAAAKGAGDFFGSKAQARAAKRRAKEGKRETQANLLQETLHRGADLELHGVQGRKRLGQRKAQGHLDTADIVRGAMRLK